MKLADILNDAHENVDMAAVEAVVDATHRFKKIFYED